MRTMLCKLSRVAIAALGAGTLLGGGCLPNNFWADSWGDLLSTVATNVGNTVLVGPLTTALTAFGT